MWLVKLRWQCCFLDWSLGGRKVSDWHRKHLFFFFRTHLSKWKCSSLTGDKKLRWKGGQAGQIRGTLGIESSLGIHKGLIPTDARIQWCSSPWYKIAQYSGPSAFAGLMLCIHRLPIHRFRFLRLLYPQFLPSSGLFCQGWNIQKLEGCLDFESEAVPGHPILSAVLTTPFFSWYFLFLKEHSISQLFSADRGIDIGGR